LFTEKKKIFNKLENNPQIKGITLKTRVATPKKPNSARRPVAKINLMNLNSLVGHIPGIGHNLRKHSMVLVRGGNVKDLPGVSYKCIRGVYDLASVQNRLTRRSLYGVEKSESLKTKIRRKFRQN
jgi:small subunit ribosomal protein S12